MSLGYSNDGGLPPNLVVAQSEGQDMMMDHDATMIMDMDMPLSMDLDIDLGGSGEQQMFDSGPRPLPQHSQQLVQSGQQAPRARMGPSGQSGTPGRPGLPQDQSLPESLASGSTQATRSSQASREQSVQGVGTGPLPTGFGMAPPPSSSTLTEFTKRRNWSQRIIEEVKDFLHILSPDGRILWVSPSCKSLTGHEPAALTGKFMMEFIHPDDSGIFWREFNESIASGKFMRFFYRLKRDDASYAIFECDGHPHITGNATQPPGNFPQNNPGTLVQGGNTPHGHCSGVFMMARQYPTKSAALLDSFLEHKMENERLKKKIEELQKEEAEEKAEQEKALRSHGISPLHPAQSPMRPASVSRGEDSVSDPPDYQGMPPPAKPSISNTALTQQNLSSVMSSQRPDSIADKMSRYEANNTHLESIEMMTGLQYREGERSHGISTGDASPALIRGDAGIAILLDRNRDNSKKERKKVKVAEEFVCADCGTLDSPEWRKGPKGPKTLCNACGLRWAKKEKKRGGDDGKDGSPPHGGYMSSSSNPYGIGMSDAHM
jgi:PAS domain S-box-containing protein